MKFLLPALVLVTSIIGSIANINITSDSWYDELIKSSLNPPGFVFGLVWPILYLLMAIVSFQASEKIWKLFILQLILNAAWSWIFFYFQAPTISAIVWKDSLLPKSGQTHVENTRITMQTLGKYTNRSANTS